MCRKMGRISEGDLGMKTDSKVMQFSYSAIEIEYVVEDITKLLTSLLHNSEDNVDDVRSKVKPAADSSNNILDHLTTVRREAM